MPCLLPLPVQSLPQPPETLTAGPGAARRQLLLLLHTALLLLLVLVEVTAAEVLVVVGLEILEVAITKVLQLLQPDMEIPEPRAFGPVVTMMRFDTRSRRPPRILI